MQFFAGTPVAQRYMDDSLSQSEKARYARQLYALPGFSEDSQRTLKRARVLIVGLGGLGSPAALYLAASGIGTLGLADMDLVDLSNLQRQILYKTEQIGRAKTSVAAETLKKLNPHIHLELHPSGLTPENAKELLQTYDLILDCSDHFRIRFLVNDAAYLAKKPIIHAGVSGYEGQLMVIDSARKSPCLRCLMPEIPQSASTTGILAPLAGMMGSLQALAAIKLLCRLGQPQEGKLFHLDGLSMRTQIVPVQRNSRCPLCGQCPTIKELCPQTYLKK